MASPDCISIRIPGARISRLAAALLMCGWTCAWAQEIQFNMDVLDVKDRKNIDLTQFSRRGYIMPGVYNMDVELNSQALPEQTIAFYPPDVDEKGSEACLTPEFIQLLGLKAGLDTKFKPWHQGECLDIQTLDGTKVSGDLGSSKLNISIPQAYLEYSSPDWDPPSRWEEGIPGLLLDYNVNLQTNRQLRTGSQGYNLSGNGTVGGNVGAWRLRADWQSRIDHQTGSGSGNQNNQDLSWSRYYAYRAIPRLKSSLVVGEDYLVSDIFDSFRFTGASLRSSDSMLPPNLRGYAPEVSGVAKTNAKVVISQQGRVIYEAQVAAGPFRIQDLNNAVFGVLDVRVEEQDGSVQTFQINTASVPYLTRPGQIRFKLASGRPSSWDHGMDGSGFATGEFSWGINNGWSLYGGALLGGNYNALAIGVGRDLLALGAISFDVTQSRAKLPHSATRAGTSYKVNYSKRFEEYDSQVTFAGYRFSERDFMTMSEYLEARRGSPIVPGSSKEMYTISLNKQFKEWGISAYLNYFHQTYWNRPDSDRYNLMLSRYFDIGRFKNINASVTAYRNQYNGTNDDGLFLSFSMPWGETASVSSSTAFTRTNTTQTLSYYDRINSRDTYSVTAGSSRFGAEGSAYYNHDGDSAQVNANASYQNGRYSAAGINVMGGATVTKEGSAWHRNNVPGGTRILLDTDGVANVPVRGYGAAINSNAKGKVVVSDVSSYMRNSVSVDVDKLADNAEATRSVVQATLTEGAIGYRRFEVIAGEKAMAILRLADGSYPPFGATVLNARKQQTGIVDEEGSVYLSGINAGDRMSVRWDGEERCVVELPPILPPMSQSSLLLPCVPVNGKNLTAPTIANSKAVVATKITSEMDKS